MFEQPLLKQRFLEEIKQKKLKQLQLMEQKKMTLNMPTQSIEATGYNSDFNGDFEQNLPNRIIASTQKLQKAQKYLLGQQTSQSSKEFFKALAGLQQSSMELQKVMRKKRNFVTQEQRQRLILQSQNTQRERMEVSVNQKVNFKDSLHQKHFLNFKMSKKEDQQSSHSHSKQFISDPIKTIDSKVVSPKNNFKITANSFYFGSLSSKHQAFSSSHSNTNDIFDSLKRFTEPSEQNIIDRVRQYQKPPTEEQISNSSRSHIIDNLKQRLIKSKHNMFRQHPSQSILMHRYHSQDQLKIIQQQSERPLLSLSPKK